MSVSLLMACDPRLSPEDHVSALSLAGPWDHVVLSTAGCDADVVNALRAHSPQAVFAEGPLCSPAEALLRCASKARGTTHVLLHANRPVPHAHLKALSRKLAGPSLACVGVHTNAPSLDAILGGQADISCGAIHSSLWTRVPRLRDIDIGLIGVLAVRAAIHHQCVTVPALTCSTPVANTPAYHATGESTSALGVREQLAILLHLHQTLPPKAVGPAIRLALSAVLNRLDPWVRHRQALYKQSHTTVWTPPRPDGVPMRAGLTAPSSSQVRTLDSAPGDPPG